MSLRYCKEIVGLSIGLLAIAVRAQFVVGDDFTDSARDVSKWGASDQSTGGADWIEASGVLNLVATDFGSGEAVRVWNGRSPSFTNNWEVTADLRLATADFLDEGAVALTLVVGDAGNPGNTFRISLALISSFDGFLRQLNAEARVNGVTAGTLDDAFTSQSAKVRIRYDAHSRMLSAGTVDGANQFTPLAQWNSMQWPMNGSSLFRVTIEGVAFGAATAVGQASVDNVQISESAPRVLGSVAGSDDFNDNSRSLEKWGPLDVTFGFGQLEEVGGGIRFDTRGASSDLDLAGRLWYPGVGEFGKAWTAQVDVAVPALALEDGNEVEIGLVVLNLFDPGDLASITLNIENQQGSDFRWFSAGINRDGDGVPDLDLDIPTTALSAAFRARWEPSEQRLYLEYDPNGSAGGYQWTVAANYLLNAGESSWELGPGSQFQVGVFGGAYGAALVDTSANVRADNFIVTGDAVVAAPVKLGAVTKLGNQIKLVWEGGKGPYQVQSRPAINSGAWANVGAPVAGKEASVDLAGPAGFYRILDLGQ